MQETSTKCITSRCKATPTQLNHLAEFMKSHTDLASGLGQTLQGRVTCEALWQKLTTELNSLGGPIKTAAKWKQAWRDMRNNVKKKAAQNRSEFRGYGPGNTGNGPPTLKQLTPAEKQVSSVMDPVAVFGLEDFISTESDSNEQSQVKYENSEQVNVEERDEEGEEQVIEENALHDISEPIRAQYQKPKTDQRLADTSHASRSLKRRMHTANRARKQYKTMRQDCVDSSEHEFDLFCKSLAVQLKNMPLHRALICQQKLQTVMTRERLKSIATYSPSQSSFVDVNFQSPRRSSSRSSNDDDDVE